MKITPKDFQTTLMRAGYALPKYGADGYWGAETMNACATWFDDATPIEVVQFGEELPPDIPQEPVIPPNWMPDCKMERVITHWTAGSHSASENDIDHYHIIVEGSGRLIRGSHSIADNVSTSDGVYAAHTKDKNTGSIGVAVACMAGALEGPPLYTGQYPMLEEQWRMMARIVAELCRHYSIPVDEEHVLGHGCVQANLGVAQEGKWDPDALPWAPGLSLQEADDAFRAEVRSFM